MEGYQDTKEQLKKELLNDPECKSMIVSTELLRGIFEEIHKIFWQVKDTCTRAEKAEAQNAKLRDAIQKHLDKCKGIEPKLYVFFGFGELQKALKETEKP